ncbi:hypothetical protein RI662_10640 [Brevibacillus agri]|uniref:BC1872 family protein n=1 Tax=Brevibacillus agri TaxID=51101 RepID=UPI0002A5220C|nr:hypothetical protein [Brevibacillus agri]ELK39059.1 hypothetical protein D478_26544 [Brevibacillus agri BAB-2500]MDR9504747.1 hypothetical protein [Brevibacillus agri]
MTEQQIIETLATKVMGWKVDGIAYVMADNPDYMVGVQVANWNPLQNIADAWQLLTKLKETYRNAGIVYNDETELWECHAGYDGHSYFAIDEEGKTECEAICNAGMKAAEEMHLTKR